MPCRIGRRRRGVADVTGVPARCVGVLAVLPALAGPQAASADSQPYFAAAGYLIGLVILVVFGIWGFRIGSGRRDDGNGGGSKRPDAGPPLPSGGRDATDDFAAWEEECQPQEPAGPHEPRGDRRTVQRTYQDGGSASFKRASLDARRLPSAR
jgi:hypothetical protein